MRYGSVCSGVEAATLAWHPLGWQAEFYSEIEPFPAAVLAHHYPDVPNLGDMTKINGENYIGKIDLITGGTPCQSFSTAGHRQGLNDDRGNLCLKFAQLAHRARCRWVLWENVPGVLSSNGGRDFAGLLSLLSGWAVDVPTVDRKGSRKWKNSGIITPGPDGFGLAWRVLDAQFVRVDGYPRAVPQRRRRVFVVGYRGDWRRAAAVLFDAASMSESPKPRRTAATGVARTVTASTGGPGAKEQQYNFVDGLGRPLNALESTWWNGDNIADTLTCSSNQQRMPDKNRMQAIIQNCYGVKTSFIPRINKELSFTLTVADKFATIIPPDQIRRLLPVECERLMGFPDDYTRIPWRKKPAKQCPDGHRYKVCGNSQCVNVMRWIGQRIDYVDKLTLKE